LQVLSLRLLLLSDEHSQPCLCSPLLCRSPWLLLEFESQVHY
jgi:hypothetical protein